VDKMLVILPFEKEFYETKWDYKVAYVGHPLVQVVQEFLRTNGSAPTFSKAHSGIAARQPPAGSSQETAPDAGSLHCLSAIPVRSGQSRRAGRQLFKLF
jgi:hypothetical protein